MFNLFAKKYECEVCKQKFDKNDDFIQHSKTIHNRTILKCPSCGEKFVHEKDRLHHIREERQKEKDSRRYKKL